MKFILNESNAKYTLLEDDEAVLTLNDINAETDLVKDYKEEILKATKANNKKLLELLWDNFYEKIGKEIGGLTIDNLKNLGQAFRVECMNLGFTENTNPFIKFLKIAGSAVLTTLSTTKTQSYAALHNNYSTYSQGIVTADDLKGEGILGKANIIFAADLYRKSADDVNTYLYLQKEVLNSVTKLDGDDLTKFINAFFESGATATTVSNGILRKTNIVAEKLATEFNVSASKKDKIVLEGTDDPKINSILDKMGITTGKTGEAKLAVAEILRLAKYSGDAKQKIIDELKISDIKTINIASGSIIDAIAKINGVLANVSFADTNALKGILTKLANIIHGANTGDK